MSSVRRCLIILLAQSLIRFTSTQPPDPEIPPEYSDSPNNASHHRSLSRYRGDGTAACWKFCNSFRQSWGQFDIKCNELPDQAKDEDWYCKRICHYCKDENSGECNEKGDVITCNADSVKNQCRDRCNTHRPSENFLGEFTISCANNTLFPTDLAKEMCERDCDMCDPDKNGDCEHYYYRCKDEEFDEDNPSNKKPARLIHCPSVETPPAAPTEPPLAEPPVYEDSDCETQCDLNRPESKEEGKDSYTLSCSAAYEGDSRGRDNCIDACSKCPFDVCDAYEQVYKPRCTKKVVPVFYTCPVSRKAGKPEVPGPGKYWISWLIIGLNAVMVIGCILSASFYGNWNGKDRRPPTQGETVQPPAPPPAEVAPTVKENEVTPKNEVKEQDSSNISASSELPQADSVSIANSGAM